MSKPDTTSLDYRLYDNKEKIIEATMAALIAQGGPSVMLGHDESAECRYRGEQNRKCAAGMWIPDDLYDPAIEGNVFEHTMFGKYKNKDFFHWACTHADTLKFLQSVHDQAAEYYAVDTVKDQPAWETALSRAFDYQMKGIDLSA